MKTAHRFLIYGISKTFLIKIIIFLIILLIGKNVFAEDFDVTNSITAPTCSGSTCSGGHYTALEIYNSGSQNVYSVGTRYNGQLSTMRFNVPLPNNWPDGNYYSTGDLVYTLTLNMATSDWRNHFAQPFISNYSGGTNFATSSVVYVSMKKIYFNFKIPNGTTTDFLYVYLQSPNQSTTAFTGVSNWNLSSVVLTANFPGSSGSGGGSSGATNNDIINSNNDNTQNIINNNNDNTNNIIDNANQNTQEIINNQNNNSLTCANDRLVYFTPLIEGYYIADGYNDTNSDFNVSNFIGVKENHYYTINFNNITGMEWGHMCWYHDQEKLSCTQYRNMTGYSATNFNVTAPTGANYLQVTYRKNSNANIKGYICTNKVDDSTNNIINNQNQNTQSTNETIENQFTRCYETTSYNLFPSSLPSTKSYNGITIESDGKGTYTINGTASSTTEIYFDLTNTFTIPYSYGQGGQGKFYIFNNFHSSARFNLYYNDNIVDYWPLGSDNRVSSNYSAMGNKMVNKIGFLIPSGDTITNGKISPMITNDGDTTHDFIPHFTTTCVNRLDDQTNAINDVNDSINNDNVDSGTGSDFFNDFATDDNGGISGIITKPLVLINSLLDSNNSCSALPLSISFPGLQAKQVSFPSGCVLWDNVPQNVVSIYQIFVVGFCSYYLLKRLFKDVEDLKNPEKDNVEVIDL